MTSYNSAQDANSEEVYESRRVTTHYTQVGVALSPCVSGRQSHAILVGLCNKVVFQVGYEDEEYEYYEEEELKQVTDTPPHELPKPL